MQNYFQLFGRLVSDIELRETKDGKIVGELRIAVRREFKNMNGEYDTDFLRVSLWEGVANNGSQYVKKGDQILVSGRIATSRYEISEEKQITTIDLIGEKLTFIAKSPKE